MYGNTSNDNTDENENGNENEDNNENGSDMDNDSDIDNDLNSTISVENVDITQLPSFDMDRVLTRSPIPILIANKQRKKSQENWGQHHCDVPNVSREQRMTIMNQDIGPQ